MTYKIVGDDCLDLMDTQKASGKYTNVPMDVHIDGRKYTDKASILREMPKSTDAPHTACPSIGEFAEAFLGADDVYVVCLSERLSGSYSAALQAADIVSTQYPDMNIHVFNSRSAAAAQTLIGLKIEELAGILSFNEVVKRVESYISELSTLFTLESLDNFVKNGRITKFQATAVALANVKIVCGGNKDGEIVERGKAIGMKKALKKMTSFAQPSEGHSHAIITNVDNMERAWNVKEMLIANGFEQVDIVEGGNISTVYANSGGLVLAW